MFDLFGRTSDAIMLPSFLMSLRRGERSAVQSPPEGLPPGLADIRPSFLIATFPCFLHLEVATAAMCPFFLQLGVSAAEICPSLLQLGVASAVSSRPYYTARVVRSAAETTDSRVFFSCLRLFWWIFLLNISLISFYILY